MARFEVITPDESLGRRDGLAKAAAASDADVCIALGPHARPAPGFEEPLAAAVEAGAALAAPVIDTPAGAVYGYRSAPDGALLPIFHPGEPADALALDCIAAPRSFFLERMPELDASAGFYELELARAAGGPLAVVEQARVRREAGGPAISVIVCTQDRAEELAPCVDALAAHGVLAQGCEIVIVDSASKDETPEVAAELAERFGPGVRVVREDVPGLSVARVAGAKAAAHEVLAYIDDDARVAPGWIESLRAAYADPDTTIAGGPIYALWPAPGARDFAPPSLHPYFSVLSHGDRDFATEVVDCYGANWSIRREALDAIGGFDERWGAGRGGLLPGEETAAEFSLRRLGMGHSRYVAGAALGHRIDPGRLDERWMVVRTYRHGLIIPFVRARFEDPGQALAQQLANQSAAALLALCPLTGSHDASSALAAILASSEPLEAKAQAARELGTLVRSLVLLGAPECEAGALRLLARREDATGRVQLAEADAQAAPRATAPAAFTTIDADPAPRLRILAIVPAFNEADVIRHTVEDLIANGCDVHLLDNGSTDGTADRVRDLLGRGLVRIERFPEDSGFDARNGSNFVLRDQLRRFEQIAAETDYDWYLICDSDEFRESPWPGTTLAEGIGLVHAAGYDAIQFELFNFRPTDDGFEPGSDVRDHITAYEPCEWFDRGQVKCWRDPGGPVDLSELFGVGAMFPGRRVFPIPFILRHYPIRGETHGRRKVLQERLGRFAPDEKRDGWHIQYDAYAADDVRFTWDPGELTEWDGDAVRARLLGRGARSLLLAQAASSTEASAAWIARAVGAEVSEADVDAAVRRIGELLAPGAAAQESDPVLLAVARLLANEHELKGLFREATALEGVARTIAVNAAPRFSTVAFADELLEDPELLADYGRAFEANDDATLVILAPGVPAERLIHAVAQAGLDGDSSPDLLALTGEDDAPDAVHAVFSRRERHPFGDVPRVADARELRALAEQSRRRAA